jgi:hypothetical protein
MGFPGSTSREEVEEFLERAQQDVMFRECVAAGRLPVVENAPPRRMKARMHRTQLGAIFDCRGPKALRHATGSFLRRDGPRAEAQLEVAQASGAPLQQFSVR